MLSLEGKQLGNYDVTRRIRVGGMGAVYEGRQRTAFDRRVAIKVILGNYASDKDMRRRFAREARTIARLHHPHILQLIEFGDEHGILYLVMPFIDGGTLTSYLRRSLPDLSEVATIYQQLLDAVEYAHDEGLVHRDIKSSNVLMEQRRNGAPYVYLADFGLVRTMRQPDDSRTGKPIPLDQVPGTPHYMAPEQTRGIVTPLTDIYALGVLLYQLLTGELPYNDPDDVRVIQMHLSSPIPAPSDSDASIPMELDEVVRTAMAKRQEDRYRSVAELREAFLAAIKGPLPTSPDEDAGFDDPFASAPLPPRRLSVPLQQYSETPQPRRSQRLPELHPAPVAARENAHTTENVRQRPRITEEPMSRVHIQRPVRRYNRGWLTMAVLVPLVLLALLVLPRVLNISLFPSGFPIFGTTPVATIYVTARSEEFKNTYVLTASPNVKQADPNAQTVPDRLLATSSSQTATVNTTGTRSTDGAQAQGYVYFINTNKTPVTIQPLTLTTSTGVSIQISQPTFVQANQHGVSGTARVIGQAVNAGSAGNIPVHALEGTCCNNGVSVTNDAFTGGVDASSNHTVAQADLDGVQHTLESKLRTQVAQKIQQQIHNGEVMALPITYTVKVTSSAPVGSDADSVQVTVKVDGSTASYNKAVVDGIASQLLQQKAQQELGTSYASYQLQGTPVADGPLTVHSGDNGIIYINGSTHGFWLYNLTTTETSHWSQSIKGSSRAAALAYLSTQAGVNNVSIQLPFGSDALPASAENIKIVLLNVATPTT